MKRLRKEKISEKTVITATPQDQAIANIYEISNNKIVAGVDYTVSELITMTIVPSSNATTVMLANYLSDNDPDAFLDRMNAKAQELGMTNTKWSMPAVQRRFLSRDITILRITIILSAIRQQPVIWRFWPTTLSTTILRF